MIPVASAADPCPSPQSPVPGAGNVLLRQATHEDIPALRQLFRTTVLTVNSRDYTEAEVADWASCADRPGHWEALVKGLYLLVALADDGRQVVGFAGIRDDGYLHSLFVHAGHQREGIGSLLLARMEAYAAVCGAACVHSEVSITARPFFKRHGYAVECRQSRQARVLWLTNYRMSKRLKQEAEGRACAR